MLASPTRVPLKPYKARVRNDVRHDDRNDHARAAAAARCCMQVSSWVVRRCTWAGAVRQPLALARV